MRRRKNEKYFSYQISMLLVYVQHVIDIALSGHTNKISSHNNSELYHLLHKAMNLGIPRKWVV